jgi:Glycosyltransferases involved in cell wall biogenesis
MIRKTFFSILIPTRNRAKTLKHTLKTCLNIEYDNFEIVVSDNNSSDDTYGIVESFHSDKLRYFNTKESLAMTKNFEFGMSKVKGEYVLVLGDDDGIYSQSLSVLNKIIGITNARIIKWDANHFFWGNFINSEKRNLLILKKRFEELRIIDMSEQRKKVLNFEESYTTLPMLYFNSVVHIDVINDIKKRTKRVFDSMAPDVYSALALSFADNKFLSIDLPLTLIGQSSFSNGASHFEGNGEANIKKQFMDLNQKDLVLNKSSFDIILPALSLTIEDSFNYIRENFPEACNEELNYFNYLDTLMNEIVHSIGCYNDSSFCDFRELLNYIEKCIIDNIKLFPYLDYFRKRYLEKANDIFKHKAINEESKINILYHYNGNPNSICLDTKELGIDEIFNAVTISDSILHYKDCFDIYIYENFGSFLKMKRFIKRISNWKRIGIYGTGRHTDILLKYFKSQAISGEIFLIDLNIKEISDFKVYTQSEIPLLDLDGIVISSYSFQEIIYERIIKLHNDIEIIKLYEEGEKFYLPSLLKLLDGDIDKL